MGHSGTHVDVPVWECTVFFFTSCSEFEKGVSVLWLTVTWPFFLAVKLVTAAAMSSSSGSSGPESESAARKRRRIESLSSKRIFVTFHFLNFYFSDLQPCFDKDW